MKFSCEKSSLLNAVIICSHAVAQKSSVPSLEGLLIEAGASITVSGYDLKTGIKANVPADVTKPGSVVVPARLFADIIRKLPDDIISFNCDDNLIITIVCGNYRGEIIGISSYNYPELPSVDSATGIKIGEKTIRQMISQTLFAVSDNEARQIHTGALFEVCNNTLTIVAVDGYRLALRKEPTENDAFDGTFVVPGAALSEVEKITSADSEELITIVQGEKHIVFKIGNITITTRRLEGNFLNYKNSLPKAGKFNILADKRALIQTVERVSLIISDRLKSPVRCIFEDNLLKVYAVTGLGKANDECGIEGNGDGLEIGFNNRYLLDALKAAPADRVKIVLSSGVSPCLIVPEKEEQDNFLYMILPVRLKANEN